MRVISLFSGAGGFDLGLIRAGHSVVWANDNYLDAACTYRQNIGDHIDTRDIREVPSEDIPGGDLVIGGFPCQGFSVANWGRKTNDKRNFLYLEVVRVVRDKMPRYFIVENVKGLLSLDKGRVLKRIEFDFREIGYATQWRVLNCADYGVPQKRLRFIMLGTRQDQSSVHLSFPPRKTHGDPTQLTFDAAAKPWVTVGEALSSYPDPDGTHDLPNHQYSRYKLRFNGHLGHRFIDPHAPAPTVTGRGDSKGGVVVLHHPSNLRRMSVRELAAVQSFPDWYRFSGTKTSGYRQVANAVPPLLGQALGAMLIEDVPSSTMFVP